jgi:hypothetical protein
MYWFRNLLVVVGLALIPGCGQPKSAPVPVETPAQAKTLSEQKNSELVESANPQGEPNPPVALVATSTDKKTAEQSFQQALTAFQDGRLDRLFDCLPTSYQTDVTDLVHTFAAKMDPELWSKGFGLLNKLAHLLKTKKELILGLEGLKRIPQSDAVKSNWDAMAGGLADVATSELSDLGKLKQIEASRLLESGNRMLSGLPLPKLTDIEVTTIRSEGDTATLFYKEKQNPEPRQVELVRVEGKWLPKTIAESWRGTIDNGKQRLTELPDRLASWKPEVIKQFDTIGGMLDQLQAAKTPQEFNTAMAPLVFMVAFGAQLAQQAVLESEVASRKGHAVYCIINRELKESELTQFRDFVTKILADSGSLPDYELIPNDGKTRCRFTPVVEPESLVHALEKHFEKASVRWDAETKTISVEFN